MTSARLTFLVLVAAAVASLLFSACASDSPSSATAAHPDAIALACPPKRLDEGEIASQNENPKSKRSVVPGKPDRLLLCRYLGLNHGKRSDTLLRRRLVANPSVVRSIAEEFKGLRPFPKGAFACPNDDGSRIYAFFQYEAEPPVVVEVSFTGCWVASNGRAHAVVPSMHLEHRLKDLLRPDWRTSLTRKPRRVAA